MKAMYVMAVINIDMYMDIHHFQTWKMHINLPIFDICLIAQGICMESPDLCYR